jgi:hypothetical protein
MTTIFQRLEELEIAQEAYTEGSSASDMSLIHEMEKIVAEIHVAAEETSLEPEPPPQGAVLGITGTIGDGGVETVFQASLKGHKL